MLFLWARDAISLIETTLEDEGKDLPLSNSSTIKKDMKI